MANGIAISWAALFIFDLIGIVVSVESSQCSLFCMCDVWYGLQRASCTGRHLYSIDTGAPNTVQALDLSDNVIPVLHSFELADARTTSVKYLNLSGNVISEIRLNAFGDLKDLTVLDLSKNHLYYILDDVFVENENLRVLKLSKNNFNSHVPKLRSSWLTELSLDSCQISHLPLDTFNGLPQIRRLDLSNNLMIQMSSGVVQPLHFLKKLSLQGNPWSCNKILSDLQIYFNQNNIQFDQICGNTAPHKFEKMILPPAKKQQNYRHSAKTDIDQSTKSNFSSVLNNKVASPCGEGTNQTIIVDPINKIIPYWFIFIGFLFGIATGMILSYVWLSGMLSCARRYGQRESFNDSSQRLSLLLNPYFQERVDSDVSLATFCPGTPPPPYRDVMLRPTLYRSPFTVSNLNNNGYRERCA